jgi:alcohol dehydrogenase
MIPFDFCPRTRIAFGPGKVEMLGELAEELGAARALVVSDPGVVSAGHAQKGIDSLTGRGIQAALFDGVEENPTTRNVESGLEVARDFRPDVLIGLGGGSSMDCAKGINFLYSCGGRMQDYWGVGKATHSLLPSIAVPTTAGTGSETQSFALISDAETHVKMACGDKQASFRVAILDPVLTITQPARVTALTGVDALAHAVETYVTKRRNAVSLAFSREAWQLLAENFAGVLNDPCDLDARSGMQLGACFAGLAIENSMLGAAHALANPLTSHFGVVHGQAVGLMLPHVIRFNGEVFGQWYRDLLECTADSNGMPPPASGAAGLADFVASLVRKAGLASRLTDCGVAADRLPVLASDAARQWTGTFNPREVDEAALLEIYRQAM